MTIKTLHAKSWFLSALSGTLIVTALLCDHVLHAEFIANTLMVLATAVVGIPIALSAWRALRIRVVGIDLLVSVAAAGALVIGEYWEAAAVTFLFAIGHVLEAATLAKTRSSLGELIAVAPDIAIVLRDGQQHEVRAGRVKVGEIVVVKHGEKVPVDGVIVSGVGSIDESTITGESIPVEKSTDDNVFAGTISRSGLLQIRTTGSGRDTTLARIIHRVEEAQDAKAKTAQFMDRFAKWYTPAIIAGSAIIGLITSDINLGLTLLVIGCPGALVISLPVSIVAGIGRAARDGILIKGGEFLETTAKIDTVAFDKTGTLTQGKPALASITLLPETNRVIASDESATEETEIVKWAAIAEAGSSHPLAKTIIDAAEARHVAPSGIAEENETIPGKGIVAKSGPHQILVGNHALLQQFNISNEATAGSTANEISHNGQTPLIVAVDGIAIGVIGVADAIREDAHSLVPSLKKLGIRDVLMLTGDTPQVATAVGSQLGIRSIHASLLPEDKLNVVHEYQSRGHTVAMVGDGVNDAPALAFANIGVAMGAAGSAVAIETADIALMSNKLVKLAEGISVAKRTVRVMRENIVFALTTVALLLLGVILGGVTMSIGMLIHELSVLLVILNAMRLLRRPTLE